MKKTIGILSVVSGVHYSGPYFKLASHKFNNTSNNWTRPKGLSVSVSPFRVRPEILLQLEYSHRVHKLNHSIKLAIRFIQLSVLFTPVIISLPLYLIRTRFLTTNMDTESWWPHLLTWSVQYAGPSFIKVIINYSSMLIIKLVGSIFQYTARYSPSRNMQTTHSTTIKHPHRPTLSNNEKRHVKIHSNRR